MIILNKKQDIVLKIVCIKCGDNVFKRIREKVQVVK